MVIVSQNKAPDNERLEKWLSEHDGEDYCKYCIYDDGCPHGMACYGGEPVEHPCCNKDIRSILDIKAIIEYLEDESE